MRIGVAVFVTEDGIQPAELAVAAEERGFESLFLPEHTHMPVDHTPHPSGAPLPEKYRRTYDTFTALAVAAQATSTLRIGTGVCLAAQHHPLNLAKATATIDRLSGGRFEFGVGYGWNRPEIEHHGVAFTDRVAAVGERIEAVRRLWSQEEATYHGRFVDFAPTWSWPKPIQQSGPPVLIGGPARPAVIRHVVGLADGWAPSYSPDLVDGVEALRATANAAGRDPATISLSVFANDATAVPAAAALGADRVVVWLETGGTRTVTRALDALAPAVDAYG